MLEPDLGYYLRAVRTRWKYLVVGAVAGALVGLALAGAGGTKTGWTVTQRVEMSDTADFLTSGELPDLDLPEREATEEAAYIRFVARELSEDDGLTLVASDASGTVEVVVAAGRRSTAEERLGVVLDRYLGERTADYDERLDVLDRTLQFQQSALVDSLAELDVMVAEASDGASIAAQAVVAERAATLSALQDVDGALRMVTDLRSTQTGGVGAAGDAIAERTTTVTKSLPLVVAFIVVGLGLGVVAAMLQKARRRSIESEADLSLFPSLVTVGALDALDSDTLARFADGEHESRAPAEPDYLVTESLVGRRAEDLLTRLEADGLSVAGRTCQQLARGRTPAEAQQGIIIAVDRSRDSERSVLDLITLLEPAAGRPLFAVLC